MGSKRKIIAAIFCTATLLCPPHVQAGHQPSHLAPKSFTTGGKTAIAQAKIELRTFVDFLEDMGTEAAVRGGDSFELDCTQGEKGVVWAINAESGKRIFLWNISKEFMEHLRAAKIQRYHFNVNTSTGDYETWAREILTPTHPLIKLVDRALGIKTGRRTFLFLLAESIRRAGSRSNAGQAASVAINVFTPSSPAKPPSLLNEIRMRLLIDAIHGYTFEPSDNFAIALDEESVIRGNYQLGGINVLEGILFNLRSVVQAGVQKNPQLLRYLQDAIVHGHQPPEVKHRLVAEYNQLTSTHPAFRLDPGILNRAAGPHTTGKLLLERSRSGNHRFFDTMESELLGWLENEDSRAVARADWLGLVGRMFRSQVQDLCQQGQNPFNWRDMRRLADIDGLLGKVLGRVQSLQRYDVSQQLEKSRQQTRKAIENTTVRTTEKPPSKIEPDLAKYFPDQEFTAEEQGEMVQYLREFLKAHEDIVVQDPAETLQSLMDEHRWDIALQPLPSAEPILFETAHKRFVNQLPKKLQSKIFARKIRCPPFRDHLKDFLGKMVWANERLARGEQEFLRIFGRDPSSYEHLELTNATGLSLEPSDDAKLVYRLEFSLGGKTLSVLLQGIGKTKKPIAGQERDPRWVSYLRYLEALDLPGATCACYPMSAKSMLGKITLMHHPRGDSLMSLFDEKDQLKGKYATHEKDLLENLARSAAAADSLGYMEENLGTGRLPEHRVGLSVDTEAWKRGNPGFWILAGDPILRGFDSASAKQSALEWCIETRVAETHPEFHTNDFARYEMLATYVDAYVRQWQELRVKGKFLEIWIRDTFGDKSAELQAFRQRMETSPIERLMALCYSLCAKYGYVPLDIFKMEAYAATSEQKEAWQRATEAYL